MRSATIADADPALAEAYRCVVAPGCGIGALADAPLWCSVDEAALSKKELVLIEALEFKLLERHPYEALETMLEGTLHARLL